MVKLGKLNLLIQLPSGNAKIRTWAWTHVYLRDHKVWGVRLRGQSFWTWMLALSLVSRATVVQLRNSSVSVSQLTHLQHENDTSSYFMVFSQEWNELIWRKHLELCLHTISYRITHVNYHEDDCYCCVFSTLDSPALQNNEGLRFLIHLPISLTEKKVCHIF